MKQKFTTWAGCLLVALTAMVAISFTSCGDTDYGGDRDPDQDFPVDFTFKVDNEGPVDMPINGGNLTFNVECSSSWIVELAAKGLNKDMLELVGEAERVEGNGVFEVKVNPNILPMELSATISVKTDSYTIPILVRQPAR